VGYVAQKNWAISVIFNKMPRVNNRPIGENSPNLVTLTVHSSSSKSWSEVGYDDYTLKRASRGELSCFSEALTFGNVRKVSDFCWAKCRVARCFILKPKIPIWANFWGPSMKKCWYILWPFGVFYRHLGNIITIWYILCWFGTFYPVWVSSTKKYLATLDLLILTADQPLLSPPQSRTP
jgi:hypothetical protein